MGPCCSSSQDTARSAIDQQKLTTNASQNYQKLFKFEKRPYIGEQTQATKDFAKVIKAQDRPLEQRLVTLENVDSHRAALDGMVKMALDKNKEAIDKLMSMVDIKEEMVKTRDGTEIEMIIYRPKTLTSQSASAYFYAHGGGGFALTAKHQSPTMASTALNLDCVVFNIDYRLGPEVKAPTGSQDFVDAFNYVLANSNNYGIDPAKNCISGCSGGGWIVTGAANLLAKANDLSKVKALFILTGMLSNETHDLPEDKYESYDKDFGSGPLEMTSCFKLHARDYENQQNDDQLFPGRTTDDILKKYPQTVIWTSEFDFLRRDNEVFAQRLKSLGKLAEISEMPGTVHAYQQFGASQETTWFLEEEKLAFTHLVDN